MQFIKMIKKFFMKKKIVQIFRKGGMDKVSSAMAAKVAVAVINEDHGGWMEVAKTVLDEKDIFEFKWILSRHTLLINDVVTEFKKKATS